MENDNEIGFVVYNSQLKGYLGHCDCIVVRTRSAIIFCDQIASDAEIRRLKDTYPIYKEFDILTSKPVKVILIR